MPASVGERDYTGTMYEMMRTALRLKFQFDKDDGPRLAHAGISHTSSVGNFDPLAACFYYQACKDGGTYPGMWEAHYQVRPWVMRQFDGEIRTSRFAPGMTALLPSHVEGAPPEKWGCTSMTLDQLVLQKDKEGAADGKREVWRLSESTWAGLQGLLL